MSDHDSTTGKVCRDCKQYKQFSEFGIHKYSKDKLNYHCKSCACIRSKAYVASNKEAVAARKKEYRAKPETKAKDAASFKAYKEKHKDELRTKRIEKYQTMTPEQRERKRQLNREYWDRHNKAINARRNSREWTPEAIENNRVWHSEWYKLNRDKILQQRAQYYQENRDRVIANVRSYERANPDKVRLLGRVKAHRRRIRLEAAGGDNYTRQDIERIYELQRGCCAACTKKLNGKYHIDHRIPVAKGGNNTKENIDLLCPPCNHRKSAKLPHVFAQENGRLI